MLKTKEKLVKAAFVIKGQSTLFADVDQTKKQEFSDLDSKLFKEFKLGDNYDQKKVKEKKQILAKFMEGSDIVQGSNDQAGLFLVGTNAGIHSEAPHTFNRIFISIVPCNKKDIQELADRRKEEFDEPKINFYE